MSRLGHDGGEFKLSPTDFEHEALLKRRRYLSPGRSSATKPTSRIVSLVGIKNNRVGVGLIGRSGSVVSSAKQTTSQPPRMFARRSSLPAEQQFITLGGRRGPKRPSSPVQLRSSSRGRSTAAARARSRTPERHSRSHGDSGGRHGSGSGSGRDREESRGRARAREPSSSKRAETDARHSKPLSSRTRSKSVHKNTAAARTRSQSRARSRSPTPEKRRHSESARSRTRTRSPTPSQPEPEEPPKRQHRRSKSRARSSGAELNSELETTEQQLKQAKTELVALEAEAQEVLARVESKKYEVMDLQIVLDGLRKRQELQQQFLQRGDSFSSTSEAPAAAPAAAPALVSNSSPNRSKRERSLSRPRASKRPCIIDEDDEGEFEPPSVAEPVSSQLTEDERVSDDDDEEDDDDVEIIEPRRVKKEVTTPRSSKKSHHRSSSKRSATPTPTPTPTPVAEPVVVDYFWGRANKPKLLSQPRIRTFPDGCARKLRNLAFNPIKTDVFVTSSDDGALVLWNYVRQTQQISRLVSFTPSSFRDECQCAESIAWSPDGNRLALGFRDAINGQSDFCVVKLHQLSLTDATKPMVIPADRMVRKSTTLHSRGINTIAWVPEGTGDALTSRGLITAGSDHAVVLWEEHEALSAGRRDLPDFKWKVLHREHKSEVRALAVHSDRRWVFTGGLDGLVVRYDMQSYRATTLMERRKPSISKINEILEHPHNPNLLLVSSIEQAEQNLFLHDLRERYRDYRDAMTLTWVKASDSRSMSQYIVPRWSHGGFHVSCGSNSGVVNVWDVRMRDKTYPVTTPHQELRVHQKQVLHATWHPRYDALFSVSNDRNIGLLTFH
ncbi:TPA: hypothetical protein N0F65_009900 [Lagenidium giganteum]|uniref:Uncharacterized protein n=1 Tax=Lagenidium giganteum TaxID=4803 RepID=A0AAV2YVL6_9STRA|nr:TPA: hypothetical protein N0F65_009900 [Lagenidium giganteum]